MTFSMRRRAIAAYLVLAGVVSLSLGYILVRYEQGRYLEGLSDNFATRAALLADRLSSSLAADRSAEIQALAVRLARLSDARVTVIQFDGKVIGDSQVDPGTMENHAGRPEFRATLRGETGRQIRASSTIGQDMLYVAYPIYSGHRVIGAVRVARTIEAVTMALTHVRRVFAAGVILSSAMAGLVGWLFASRLLRPLNELRLAALKASSGDLTVRVNEPHEQELADLARAFNRMSSQVDRRMQETRNQRRQLEVILANLSDGIAVFDLNGRAILLNPSALVILKIAGRDWAGHTALELTLDHRFENAVGRALAGETIDDELTMRGTPNRSIAVLAYPVLGGEEVLSGVIVVLRDLTRIRQLERIRSDFVANVSHELRTPLASIRAAAETLQDGAIHDNHAAGRFLGIIVNESERLGNLVRDLLALASAESPELVLKKEPVAMKGLIHRVVESVGTAYPRGTIPIIETSLPKGDIAVLGEPERLREALFNLVDNAVKYTPRDGLVVVSVRRDGPFARISVTDNGPGISEEHLPRLFERFYRVDRDRSRAVGGTGLGLAIVRHVAEAHGGRAGVESFLGRGSTFWFTVPVCEFGD